MIDHLHELGLQYSEQQAASIFVQAAEAVAHLHEYRVLHRWARRDWGGGRASVGGPCCPSSIQLCCLRAPPSPHLLHSHTNTTPCTPRASTHSLTGTSSRRT